MHASLMDGRGRGPDRDVAPYTVPMPAKQTKKGAKKQAARSRRMTPEHKEAIARGRETTSIIRRYLEASARGGAGRRGSPERLRQRLQEVQERLADADVLKRVELIQHRMDLEAALAEADGGVRLEDLEDEFVRVLADYSSRKGLSYAAWREAGVKPDVLRRAGLSRSN